MDSWCGSNLLGGAMVYEGFILRVAGDIRSRVNWVGGRNYYIQRPKEKEMI